MRVIYTDDIGNTILKDVDKVFLNPHYVAFKVSKKRVAILRTGQDYIEVNIPSLKNQAVLDLTDFQYECVKSSELERTVDGEMIDYYKRHHYYKYESFDDAGFTHCRNEDLESFYEWAYPTYLAEMLDTACNSHSYRDIVKQSLWYALCTNKVL